MSSAASQTESQIAAQLSEYPDSSTFRILLVTDTHLGHLERSDIRRYDSFRSFDEALSIGKQYNVDFVLHAGDLFDKNQPSRFCWVKTLQILRKHCLGNKAIHFEIVSDQSRNFNNTYQNNVNYEDPNYNISLPIFIQHGNHDDPAGLGNHAALEQLSATNLVNYCGRVDNLSQIEIFPILMKKGSTKLALYPLGYIRDERLHRAFLHHCVKWIKPKNENVSDWFNIAMMHQNRSRRSGVQYKDCIPDEFMPKFLDVIYWGHEHECLIDLQESLTGNYFSTQPGSTIYTSLSKSEAKSKYVGIMEIKNDQCRLIPFKLKTIRPFVFDDICLNDHFEQDIELKDINDFLIDKVNSLVDKANDLFPKPDHTQHNHLSFITDWTDNDDNDTSRLPLIRLRVEHSGFNKIRSSIFGQNFIKNVANPDQILLWHKKGKNIDIDDKKADGARMVRGNGLFNLKLDKVVQATPIEDIVTSNIVSSDDPLVIFPELDLLTSIQEFVDKEDPHVIEEYCDKRLDELAQKLIDIKCGDNDKDISKQAAYHTDNRRKILRQNKELELLQKKDDKLLMDVDIINDDDNKNNNKNIDRNKNSNRSNINNNDNDNDKDILTDDVRLTIKKKKPRGNLNKFGFGTASQNLRDNIVNSQMNDDNNDNDDDLDLNGLGDFMETPKNKKQALLLQNQLQPSRKRRKLNNNNNNSNHGGFVDLTQNDDNDNDNNNNNNNNSGNTGNDVLDGLLGLDLANSSDDDIDMSSLKNTNKSQHHTQQNSLRRSPRIRKKNNNRNNNNNNNGIISPISQSQMSQRKNKLKNSQSQSQRNKKQSIKNSQIKNEQQDDNNNKKKKGRKKKVNPKKKQWGSLLAKRGARQKA